MSVDFTEALDTIHKLCSRGTFLGNGVSVTLKGLLPWEAGGGGIWIRRFFKRLRQIPTHASKTWNDHKLLSVIFPSV